MESLGLGFVWLVGDRGYKAHRAYLEVHGT